MSTTVATDILRTLQEANQNLLEEAEGVNHGVVTGFAMVIEWVADDGRKWLSRLSSDAAGETLTKWGGDGLMHEALYGDWEEA